MNVAIKVMYFVVAVAMIGLLFGFIDYVVNLIIESLIGYVPAEDRIIITFGEMVLTMIIGGLLIVAGVKQMRPTGGVY